MALQLVQCLKFESSVDSVISRFLLTRGWQCPAFVGHTLFWLLRSELSDPHWTERFGVLLEEYLLGLEVNFTGLTQTLGQL